ncbi:hypothetical protein D3C79_1094260 [compost metagenome]
MLFVGLYAFGNDAQPQCLAQGNDCRDNRGVIAVLLQVTHETAVDLQFVGRQALEVHEAGVTSAKVID